MLEKASILLMSRCTSATTFPAVMVRAASTVSSFVQSAVKGPSQNMGAVTTRSTAAKAAALVPAIMKAVTGVGAP